MRTVPADVTDAITLPTGHTQGGRITVYKSRVYFDALTSSHAPTAAKDIGYTGKRLNEASFLLAPESRPEIEHQVVTAFVNSSGDLFVMREGSSTETLLLSNIDPSSHIGFNANNAAGIYSIYYYNAGASQWEYQHIDIDLLLSNNSACLTGVVTSFPELPKGSIYPLAGTENTFVLLDIYEGAVRVRIYDDHKDTTPNDYRFMNPLRVLDANSEDAYLLHKASAVVKDNKVFVYYSHYDGSVKSMICTLQQDRRHGVWSDIRTSIPQDLSNFEINNAFQHNGRIFIAGNFCRKEQFASPTVYTLLVWSDDGLIFTMNRRVLCSLIYLPFQVHTDGVDVIFASTNRVYRTSAPYQIIGENTGQTVVEIVSISGSVSGEMSATLASGAEQYFNDAKIDTGCYAKLDLSIISSEGKQHVKYFDVVVSGIGKQVKDGGRGNTITLQTDANWHTSNMTHPFYMEFQGKQSVFDKAVDFSNLYKASTGINPDWTLGVDFWAEDGTAFNFQTHADTATTHWSADLAKLYAEYPVYGSLENYAVRVFGWSRAGVPDTNPNTDDPTPTNTLNDQFIPVVEYMDAAGQKIITTASLLVSSFSNPPQTYFQAGDGSYPVVFTIPNPGAGRKITRVGVKVQSRSTHSTTYYLERIEMPEISVSCVVMSGKEAAFDTIGVASNILTDTTPETFQSTAFHLSGTPVHNFGQWLYKHTYAGATLQNLLFTETYTASQIVWIRYKNNTTLPINEIRLHKKVKVLSHTHNGVWLESDAGRFYKTGETYEYISPPMTLAAGAQAYGAIYLGHDRYYSGTPGVYLEDVSTLEANIWITVGSTLSPANDNFFVGNPNAALYIGHFDMPIPGTHYFAYQKIKNNGTTPMTVKAYVETFSHVDGDEPLHYRWVSPSKSEDEKTLRFTDVFSWKSEDIILSPGDEKLVYMECWVTNAYGFDEAWIRPIAYFMDASSSASNPVDGTVGTTQVLTNKRKGIPQILFSTRPYSAWNFEATGRFEFKGDYAHAGLIGLATDEKNFVMGCITKGKAYLAHVKNGRRTVLQEVTGTINPETLYDLRLWHRDGVFGFEYKKATNYWPQRGSIVNYQWKETDGAITTNDDLYHVGAYSYLDPPRFRIVGMMSGQSILATLPIDIDNTDGNSDLINRFPVSGKIDIDGVVYNYTGKNIFFADNLPCGPYQLRNTGTWNSPYNRDPDGSFTYQGGRSIECLDFKWLPGLSNSDDYAGAIIASSAGYAWINQQTQWKPWIRTGGRQVLLRNRARFYSSTIPDWYPSTDEKIYITNGLTGISPAETPGDTYMHSPGSFAYVDSGDEVKIHGFGAASGDHDQTIRYLIDVLCSLAGTRADFIGDWKTMQTIPSGTEINLYD